MTRRYAYMCIIVGIPRYFTRSQRCSPPVPVSTSLLYCTKCPVIGPPGSLKENQPNQSDFILGHPNFMHRILAHVHRPKSEKDVPQTAHAGTRLTRQRARYQARPFSGRGVSFAGKALFVLNFHHAAAPSREIFSLSPLSNFANQPDRRSRLFALHRPGSVVGQVGREKDSWASAEPHHHHVISRRARGSHHANCDEGQTTYYPHVYKYPKNWQGRFFFWAHLNPFQMLLYFSRRACGEPMRTQAGRRGSSASSYNRGRPLGDMNNLHITSNPLHPTFRYEASGGRRVIY